MKFRTVLRLVAESKLSVDDISKLVETGELKLPKSVTIESINFRVAFEELVSQFADELGPLTPTLLFRGSGTPRKKKPRSETTITATPSGDDVGTRRSRRRAAAEA